jgi:dimethylamine---corrinoid protein Co-methyltransferase
LIKQNCKEVKLLVVTRLGDGSFVSLSVEEIRQDIEDGVQDAVSRGKIAPLSTEDMEKLVEICCMPQKFVSVEKGNELVLTYDSGTLKVTRLGIPIGMPQILQIYERAFGADSLELAYVHYSFKAIKSIVPEEQYAVAETSLVTTAPLFYGAMPNLPLYTKPDGPCLNAAELLPMGKIKEAREAQEEAVEYAIKDMVFVSSGVYEAGADGIDFDTTAAAGDAEFYATLKATEILRKKYPEMAIEIGMAGEFVLGFHGEIEYDGVRLAGLYPHQQVKLAEKAGASIFGAVVNTNSSRSFPWNLARAVTFCKACVEVANIPVHANVGMGVGAVPLVMTPPIDCVSRASTAMAEVGKLDGL